MDEKTSKTKAVVVLSGGQDSTTCLAQAIHEGKEIAHCIFFDYGQQHMGAEAATSQMAARHFGVPWLRQYLAEIEELSISALTSKGGDVSVQHPQNPDLPASFVPGRNLIFLTAASMLAYQLGATEVITGVCETDYSGYPDCRRYTIDTLEAVINLGFGIEYDQHRGGAVEDQSKETIHLITPLMYLDKADTFKLALDISPETLSFIINRTHTGYTGSRDFKWEWGYGPRASQPLDPASAIRQKGWKEFLERYPEQSLPFTSNQPDSLRFHSGG